MKNSDVDLTGDYDYPMDGSMIIVSPLDFNQDFVIINGKLDRIIEQI